MKKPYKEFLKLVRSECKKHGVKLLLRKGKSIQVGGFKCGGCFFETPLTLIVAMGHPDSKSILAHEYCHMTQWLDGEVAYIKGCISIPYMEEWLNGKSIININKHIAAVRDLELDNEIRTSKFIKKYDLGVSYTDYIRKSNAYIHFYNWLMESRSWSKPGNSPYRNKAVINAMSDKFDMNYKKLKPEIRKIYLSEKI